MFQQNIEAHTEFSQLIQIQHEDSLWSQYFIEVAGIKLQINGLYRKFVVEQKQLNDFVIRGCIPEIILL
jgi:hypothetical protein